MILTKIIHVNSNALLTSFSLSFKFYLLGLGGLCAHNMCDNQKE